jgi:hypothetical protein
MLHVKKEADLGNGQKVSVKLLMLRRLNEELLRFSEKRRQIFDQKVSRITAFDKPITTDDTIIIPEKSVAWFELLRLDWAAKSAIFIEEMGRAAPRVMAPITDDTAIPASLITRLGGEDPAWGSLRLARVPWRALITALSLAPEKYEITDLLANPQIYQIVRESGKPVMQIDLRSEGPIEAFKPIYASYSSAIMIVVDAAGPGLIVTNPEEPASVLISSLPAAVATKFRTGRLVKAKET